MWKLLKLLRGITLVILLTFKKGGNLITMYEIILMISLIFLVSVITGHYRLNVRNKEVQKWIKRGSPEVITVETLLDVPDDRLKKGLLAYTEKRRLYEYNGKHWIEI